MILSYGEPEAVLAASDWLPGASGCRGELTVVKPRAVARRGSRTALMLLLVLLTLSGNSATLVWTNIAGGNWSGPANWDSGGVPGPGDIAKITSTGNYTVTLDQPTTVGGIIVGNALANGGVQHFLVPAGITLIATAPVTINENGTFTVGSGGIVALANTAPLHLVGQGTNWGTINQTNNNIYLYNDGTTAAQGGLVNQPGGRINLNGSGGIVSGLGPVDYFLNYGEVSKTAGPFNSLLAASLGMLGGTYSAVAGTIVQFKCGTSSKPAQADPSLMLNGPGQYQFTSGVLLFPTNVIQDLDLVSGSLLLGAGFQGGTITNLTLDGVNLTNTLPVSGTLMVTNGSVNGQFQIVNGGLLVANAVVFNAQVTVEAGGTFVVGNRTAIFGNGVVTNIGLNVIEGGDLEVGSALNLDGSLTNAGTINVTNGASIVADNDGTAAYAGGLMNLSAGVINLWNNGSLSGIARGKEYLFNQGAINLMSGTAQSTIDFNYLTNGGVFAAHHGTLRIVSSHGNPQPTEILEVVINSASDFGKFSIDGAAQLNGSLRVRLSSGYVPPVGTVFSVVSYGSLASGFPNFDYPPLPAGGVWQPAYGRFALTLQEQPGFYPVSPGKVGIIVNGPPGHQAILLTSINLETPLANWTSLSTNTLDVTGYLALTNSMDRSEPRRFFTFELP